MKDRYVVYSHTGTNTHHYFTTYEEARAYLVNNRMSGMYIAYLLSYQRTSLTELETEEFCNKRGEVKYET